MTTISVPRRLFLAPALACAGCLALAARPSLVMPAFAVTLAVGLAGAVAPDETHDPTVGPIGWSAVTALGIAAFATIRLTTAVPPMPGSARVATMMVGASVAEELFFRRFLYGALARRGAAVAVLGSALAFAVVHIPAYGTRVFPLDLAAGLVLSWQRWASGSWTAPAASHIAANLMTIL
jgi:membrane protease YdiL (CAAX protease family)